MIRWFTMAMAVALIAACNQRDRETVSGAASSARANVDTAFSGAAANAETAMAGARAKVDTAGAKVDTALAKQGARDTALPPAGGVGAKFDLSGLSADQVKQLQTALNNDGCQAGPVDGVVGPRTQRGIACGMRKHDIQGQDLTALYQALDLDFGR